MTRIMVAPNGARKTKQDHPALPVTDAEVIATAVACHEAGADAIHIHIRDEQQTHLLDSKRYQSIVAAIQEAARGLELQVTSEAAGIYDAEAQIELLNALRVPWVSVSIREILRANDRNHIPTFLTDLTKRCRVQFILYDVADYEALTKLRAEGAIAGATFEVLYVLGRYAKNQMSDPTDLDPFLNFRAHLAPEIAPSAEMVCAFGPSQIACLVHAAHQGLDVRVGFENGFWLSNGRIADDNAALVSDIRSQLGDTEVSY